MQTSTIGGTPHYPILLYYTSLYYIDYGQIMLHYSEESDFFKININIDYFALSEQKIIHHHVAQSNFL